MFYIIETIPKDYYLCIQLNLHVLITQKLLFQIKIKIHQYFEKNHLPAEQFTVGEKGLI